MIVLARLATVLLLELVEPLADLLKALPTAHIIDDECNSYPGVITGHERSIYFLARRVPEKHLDGALAWDFLQQILEAKANRTLRLLITILHGPGGNGGLADVGLANENDLEGRYAEITVGFLARHNY